MNILLVYPKYPDTFWSFKSILKFISKKAAFPPLGLLTIAAMLPAKWHKKLVDLNVEELKDEHLQWADMVFLSAMMVQIENARQIIARCHALGKPVVAGGAGPTIHQEAFAGVDHFVLDEAEETLPLFLAELEQGQPKAVYRSALKPDMSQTPLPDWSLVNFKDYATMALQYSRGCPFNCEFCDIVMLYGRKPRTKSPAQMIKEIQSLYEAGWRGNLFIVDDNFIGNKANVKKMLPRLIGWQKSHKYPFALLTEASTDLADDKELMRLMSAANFHKVFLGIETTNLASLKECEKYQNTRCNLEEAVGILHHNGLQVMGGFIVGFDNDTDSIFEAQIRFIQKVGIVTAMVGLLNAIPHTRLWQRLKAEGRLLKETTGENTDGNLTFMPKMGKEKLLGGYQKIIATIYSPKNYYARINTFIKNYRPTAKNRITLDDFKAAIRSFWSIGVLSRARFLYWKLLIKTASRKIKALPMAIELAIYGLHFEKYRKKLTNT